MTHSIADATQRQQQTLALNADHAMLQIRWKLQRAMQTLQTKTHDGKQRRKDQGLEIIQKLMEKEENIKNSSLLNIHDNNKWNQQQYAQHAWKIWIYLRDNVCEHLILAKDKLQHKVGWYGEQRVDGKHSELPSRHIGCADTGVTLLNAEESNKQISMCYEFQSYSEAVMTETHSIHNTQSHIHTHSLVNAQFNQELTTRLSDDSVRKVAPPLKMKHTCAT